MVTEVLKLNLNTITLFKLDTFHCSFVSIFLLNRLVRQYDIVIGNHVPDRLEFSFPVLPLCDLGKSLNFSESLFTQI